MNWQRGIFVNSCDTKPYHVFIHDKMVGRFRWLWTARLWLWIRGRLK